MPDSKSKIFFDTVALSNFALAGRLDLLLGRYGRRVCVTPEVLDEVSEGVIVGYTALREVEAAVAERKFSRAKPLSVAERDIYRELLRVLASGEASCIACAKIRDGVVVTDDRAARDCCNECGLSCTGTIGILKACAVDGQLESREADAVLQSMIDAGYYSPVRRISDLI